MPSIDLENPQIDPASSKSITAELHRMGMTDIENPARVAQYAGALIDRLFKEGRRPLSSTAVSIRVSDDPIIARVAVDHALGGAEALVTLYLNEGRECGLLLAMSARQFLDLCAFMQGAAATGLPASLRFDQEHPPFLLDPHQGTKIPLTAAVHPVEADPAQSGS